MIVVDTRVMLRLLIGGRAGEDAARLFVQDPEWAAPVRLTGELHDTLLAFVRDRSITVDQAKSMCDDAALALGPRVVSVPSHRVIDTAAQCGLSARAAEFVVAARELGVMLATGDREVLRAARDVAMWVR